MGKNIVALSSQHEKFTFSATTHRSRFPWDSSGISRRTRKRKSHSGHGFFERVKKARRRTSFPWHGSGVKTCGQRESSNLNLGSSLGNDSSPLRIGHIRRIGHNVGSNRMELNSLNLFPKDCGLSHYCKSQEKNLLGCRFRDDITTPRFPDYSIP